MNLENFNQSLESDDLRMSKLTQLHESRDLVATKELPSMNLLQLLEFLTDFQSIEREVYVPKLHRRENDTEHSYNLALAGWLIVEKDKLPLNADLVIKYALVHDLVEVYAGDTSALDDEGRKTKIAREKTALKRLDNDQLTTELAAIIEEYEEQANPESRFVYSLDKLMATCMLIHGQSSVWREHGITYTDWQDRFLSKLQVSPYLQPYTQELLHQLRMNPHLLAD
ncbi:MAG: HD domain-containing protein [Candidatus Saccharibacteria bacterium]|nr:HD domain-containing protein [Candidatus Saccharibacteria bacterium]